MFQATKVKTVKQWFSEAEKEEEETDKIEVFPYTHDPTFAWTELCVRTVNHLSKYRIPHNCSTHSIFIRVNYQCLINILKIKL